jgi:hypothetical protein
VAPGLPPKNSYQIIGVSVHGANRENLQTHRSFCHSAVIARHHLSGAVDLAHFDQRSDPAIPVTPMFFAQAWRLPTLSENIFASTHMGKKHPSDLFA